VRNMDSDVSQRPRDAAFKGRMIWVAVAVTVLATAHFADHVIRGRLVHSRGLDPAWNHSGWPFEDRVSPFTVSLVVVYGLLLTGIALTRQGRLWAGYWLATAIVLGGIVTFVHFLGSRAETPAVILASYDNPAAGIPAVFVTFAILLSLIVMALTAIDVARKSRQWW
jgi:hypothetical protein